MSNRPQLAQMSFSLTETRSQVSNQTIEVAQDDDVHCLICKNMSWKSSIKGISFFSFPSQQRMRKEWCKVILKEFPDNEIDVMVARGKKS
jgi:hypothetical protein